MAKFILLLSLTILAYSSGSFLQNRARGVDPEINMTIEEILTTRGYPHETYWTTTQDKYILKLYRIPYGRNQTKKDYNPNVILFQHGITGSSDFSLCNKADRSLPLVMADQGFDIWLGNNRGNKYSTNHTKLNPSKDKQFWEFSFHEMGVYDLPAQIDFITSFTNNSKIIYIGHSQGTSQMFAGGSMLPDYFASKIKVFIALAPATNLAHAQGNFLKVGADLYLDRFLIDIGYTVLFNDKPSSEKTAATICAYVHVYCEATEDILLFNSKEDDDEDGYIVSEAHEPSGASVKSVSHFAEVIRSKRFKRLDKDEDYNLDNIKYPVCMHVGRDDNLATVADNVILRDRLNKNGYLHAYNEYDKVAHSTFLLGKVGQTQFINDIIKCANDFKQ